MTDALIIKYYETLIFTPDQRYAQWAKVTPTKEWVKLPYQSRYEARPRASVKIISERRAKALIGKNNLVLVHEDKDGLIYDTADREFQRKWGNDLLNIVRKEPIYHEPSPERKEPEYYYERPVEHFMKPFNQNQAL